MSERSAVELSPRETLECILGHLGFVFQVEESRHGETITLNISTREPRRLIGRDGHVLEDLQYLLNRLVSGSEEHAPRVIIDVEGYRLKEQNQFIERVRAMGERVTKSGKAETLDPMNSFDRFLVHQEFKDHPTVKSRSLEGEGRLKAIILEPRQTTPPA